ncbi:hypothetical protein DFQ30_010709 [Apophysomyces sp. BC1015]|nr:hypothetical protein DFQ30_010709 [Apophysomyces sp. BC1015]
MRRPLQLSFYNQELPRKETSAYLGVPFRSNGPIDPIHLIHRNITSALNSMRFIRPKLDYGITITKFNATQTKVLEAAQDQCLHMLYGSHRTVSTAVMRHLSNLPTMAERIACLQAKFLLCASKLPDDTLLASFLPQLTSLATSQWNKLTATSLWSRLPDPKHEISAKDMQKHTLFPF